MALHTSGAQRNVQYKFQLLGGAVGQRQLVIILQSKTSLLRLFRFTLGRLRTETSEKRWSSPFFKFAGTDIVCNVDTELKIHISGLQYMTGNFSLCSHLFCSTKNETLVSVSLAETPTWLAKRLRWLCACFRTQISATIKAR